MAVIMTSLAWLMGPKGVESISEGLDRQSALTSARWLPAQNTTHLSPNPILQVAHN